MAADGTIPGRLCARARRGGRARVPAPLRRAGPDRVGPDGPQARGARDRRTRPRPTARRCTACSTGCSLWSRRREAPVGPVVVGRADDREVDVIIPDVSISKRHCAFAAIDGAAVVTDCGSRNGTAVNGAKVAAGRAGAPRRRRDSHPRAACSSTFETAAGFAELVGSLGLSMTDDRFAGRARLARADARASPPPPSRRPAGRSVWRCRSPPTSAEARRRMAAVAELAALLRRGRDAAVAGGAGDRGRARVGGEGDRARRRGGSPVAVLARARRAARVAFPVGWPARIDPAAHAGDRGAGARRSIRRPGSRAPSRRRSTRPARSATPRRRSWRVCGRSAERSPSTRASRSRR